MAELRKPEARECERCERREVWDDDHVTWRVGGEDDAVGDVHCVHEWDIGGSFRPIE